MNKVRIVLLAIVVMLAWIGLWAWVALEDWSSSSHLLAWSRTVATRLIVYADYDYRDRVISGIQKILFVASRLS